MDDREKLRQHFLDHPAEAQTSRWDALWKQQTTPWDRSAPSPALIDTLVEKHDVLGSSLQGGKRKKALVPGCGRGYDVLLFASHGYDATGVDASETAIEACKALDEHQGSDESKYPIADSQIERGARAFMLADFFKDDFLNEAKTSQFDVIYDYTFLCALPPALRPKWAKRMAELLAPNGHLVCLEFPLGKAPSTGGPPHGLSSDLYTELFKAPGGEVKYDADGYAVQSEGGAGQGLKRVEHWAPARSHQVGQGTDRVSIWKHA
ncbi:hypothetical protein B0A48_08623 [Cryoendolithus antarcticus]|uniref:S-adenosyl-L-methionine-dependent methyltransferase n=1 Tax=Cryoendolithus antarcticus TaxID=1507870 RepID=A0A1V8T3P9_9PEZI|nr:hypothetical protein B0A48_08623 [Cryoendolithus antarcticus]